jgi:hypothetical protein
VVLSPELARADPPELREWVRDRGDAAVILTLADGRADWDDRADRFSDDADAVPPSLATAFESRPIVLDVRGADSERLDRVALRLAGAASGARSTPSPPVAPPRVSPPSPGMIPPPPPAPSGGAAPSPAAPATASSPMGAAVAPPTRRGSRRVRVVVLVAVACLALVAFAAALVSSGGDNRPAEGPSPSPAPSTPSSARGGPLPTLSPTIAGSRPPQSSPRSTTAPTVTSPPAPSTTSAPDARAQSHEAVFVWVAVGVVALAAGVLIGVQLGRRRGRRARPEGRSPQPDPPPGPAIDPPPAPVGTQVFISHDTDSDADVARALAAQLATHRLRPWLAPDSIPPGAEWVFAIEQGLTTSKAALILLSPAALASGWVRKEIQIIVDLEIAGRLYVVPVRVAPCDVPLLLTAYQWVDVGHFERAAEELGRRFPVATEG